MVFISQDIDNKAFVLGKATVTYGNNTTSVNGTVTASDVDLLVGSTLTGSPNVQPLASITITPTITNAPLIPVGVAALTANTSIAFFRIVSGVAATTSALTQGDVIITTPLASGGTVTVIINGFSRFVVTGVAGAVNAPLVLSGVLHTKVILNNVASSGNVTLNIPNGAAFELFNQGIAHPLYTSAGELRFGPPGNNPQSISIKWLNLITGYGNVEFDLPCTFTTPPIANPPGGATTVTAVFNPTSLTAFLNQDPTIIANVTATKGTANLGVGSIILSAPVLPSGGTFTTDFYGTILVSPSVFVPFLEYPPLNSCCQEIDNAFNNYTNTVVSLFKTSPTLTSSLKVAAIDVPLAIYDLVSCFNNVCNDAAVRKKIVKIINSLALNVNNSVSYLAAVNRSLSLLNDICTNCVQCDGNNNNKTDKRLDDIEANLHKLMKVASVNKYNADDLIQQLKRLKTKDKL
jgi:hypothetical protein